MQTFWAFHRRAVVAAVVVVLVVVTTGVVIAARRSPRAGKAIKAPVLAPAPKPDAGLPADQEHQLAVAGTIDPPQSAVQELIDRQLTQAETPASLAAAERAIVPPPANTTAYPPVPTADRSDPSAYAVGFATELLDINFAAQSRSDLLALAES